MGSSPGHDTWVLFTTVKHYALTFDTHYLIIKTPSKVSLQLPIIWFQGIYNFGLDVYFCKFNICQDLSCLFFAPCQLASLAFSNLQYSCFHILLHSLGYSNQLLPVSPYKSLMRYYLSFPLFKTCQMRISMNLFKYQNKPQGKIFLNVNFKIRISYFLYYLDKSSFPVSFFHLSFFNYK